MKKVFLFLLVCAGLNAEERLDIQTTEYPPYQSFVAGEPHGVSAEIVKAIVARAGFQAQIQFFPWPRAQHNLDNLSILFFNLARNKEREPHYQWIADITPYRPVLWKFKSRSDIVVRKLDDLVPWTVGVLPGSIEDLYIGGLRVQPLRVLRIAETFQNVQMLNSGRVDLVPLDEKVFPDLVQRLGLNLSDFEVAYTLSELNSNSWLVASPSVSPAVVKKLRQAWEDLKADGSIDKIRAQSQTSPR